MISSWIESGGHETGTAIGEQSAEEFSNQRGYVQCVKIEEACELCTEGQTAATNARGEKKWEEKPRGKNRKRETFPSWQTVSCRKQQSELTAGRNRKSAPKGSKALEIISKIDQQSGYVLHWPEGRDPVFLPVHRRT